MSIACQPVIPWIGGKRRLARQILPHLPDHNCFVDLFCGAGGLFLSRDKRSPSEVINDIDGDLINLYRVIKHHYSEFIRNAESLIPSREVFDEYKQVHIPSMTDIQRAVRFFYLQKLNFGGFRSKYNFGTSTTSPQPFRAESIHRDITALHQRLQGVTIERLNWLDCLSRYDRQHTLFFADPPYYQTAQYASEFDADQYYDLAAAMRSMHGKAALTINDCDLARHAFDGLRMVDLTHSYTCANVRQAKRKGVVELLVLNY